MMTQKTLMLDQVYSPLVVQLIDDVEIHLTQPLSVSKLAELLQTSTSRLSAAVNHHLQLTIPGYVMQRRLEEAAILLVETEEPMQRIAKHLPFTRQHYFSTAFRQRFQCSPSAYRSYFCGEP